MSEFTVYDLSKKATGTIELDDSVFNAEVRDQFLHQVLVSYLANQRQGTVGTKTRNTINGTKSKPFRQKGTGRARQGMWRSPHHRGGAAQFGPQMRDFRKKVTKKMRQEAFRQCLSLKNNREILLVLKDLDFSEAKTKTAAQFLKAMECAGKTLIIDVKISDNAALSLRNIPNAQALETNSCSPLDIFSSDQLILTQAAAEEFQKRYAR